MDTAISGKHEITLHGINNQKMKSCGLSVFWPTRLPSWDWPWASSVDGSCAAMQANTGENSYFLRASWSWFKPALLLLLVAFRASDLPARLPGARGGFWPRPDS